MKSMTALAKELIVAAFNAARVGIAFNAMSRHVDWQRPELFHWGFDELARLPPRARQPALCVPIGLWPLRAHHVRLAGAATSAGASAWLVHDMKRRLVVFGAKQIAEVCAFYFDHDSDYEVVAFTVDGEFLEAGTFAGRPVVSFEEIASVLSTRRRMTSSSLSATRR